MKQRLDLMIAADWLAGAHPDSEARKQVLWLCRGGRERGREWESARALPHIHERVTPSDR